MRSGIGFDDTFKAVNYIFSIVSMTNKCYIPRYTGVRNRHRESEIHAKHFTTS